MTTLNLASSPHHHNKRDIGAVMRMVLYAAIPGIVTQTIFFGFGVLIQIALAVTTAIACEALILEWRKKDVERACKDYSAVVCAVLLAISIPPLAPWWIIVIGTSFAIVIVKQLYGGLGYNLFNPAMAGYVMLLVSFPVQMTAWLPPQTLSDVDLSFVDAMYTVFTGFTASGYSIEQLREMVDGITGATPLDHVKTSLSQGYIISEAVITPILDGSYGRGWIWVSLAYLMGGLLLLKTNIIKWQIPVSMLLSATLVSFVLYLVDTSTHASPLFHLVNGSLMLGAFFIATDPVSAATTNKGRIIFGAAIGFWVVVIRTWGAYPDAVAFAVLFMNMAVPLIDYYTKPRTYGHASARSERPEQ